MDGGSKFIVKSSCGDVVVVFPLAGNVTGCSIDPRGIPNAVTVELMYVMDKSVLCTGKRQRTLDINSSANPKNSKYDVREWVLQVDRDMTDIIGITSRREHGEFRGIKKRCVQARQGGLDSQSLERTQERRHLGTLVVTGDSKVRI